jgi:hypothetical protein
VPDEAYLYILEAWDGSITVTYSPPVPTGSGTVTCTPAANYDPYKNTPLSISFNLTEPARINMSVPGESNVKILDSVAYEAENYTAEWDGMDASGKILPLTINIGCTVSSLLSENYVITYGDTPKISFVKTDPYQVTLSYGEFTKIKYSLSREAFVTIEVKQPSGRTITLMNNELRAPGVHEFKWYAIDPSDSTGKMFVTSAEGNYTVIITAVNPETGSSSMKRGNISINY